MNRREFLKGTIAAAAVAPLARFHIPDQVAQKAYSIHEVGLYTERGEVASNGYARQKVNFVERSDQYWVNDADIYFPQAEENWGTITHIALFDSNGAVLLTPVTATKFVCSGDNVCLQTTAITLEGRLT